MIPKPTRLFSRAATMLLMMLLTATTAWGTITDIGVGAFSGCTTLESIEIPASVTSIYPAAFASCTRLASVTIYAPELSEYGWHAFENNASGRKIYVFNKSLATYKAQASKMSVDENDILPIESINLKDNDDNSSLIAAAISYTGPAATRPSTPSEDTSMSVLLPPSAPSS